MSDDMIPGLEPPDRWPTTDDDWLYKWVEVSELFSPATPVRESELFAGRTEQMTKMLESIFQVGQHIVIYGERGVGKTSLINTVSQKVLRKFTKYNFFLCQCFDGDNFVSIWERVFKNYRFSDGTYADDDIDDSIDPETIYEIALRFNPNEKPIFTFDEFDRIDDKYTKTKMAETMKLFSDRNCDATIIIAGVGRTIRDLISEHESIRRSMRQIEMPRMAREEVQQLFNVRLPRVDMSITDEALRDIVWLSNGMPAYAHLLGRYSAKKALDNRGLTIAADSLFASLDTCLDETFESTRHAYSRATQSSQPNNKLKESLLACAIAKQDEFGTFTAGAVRRPLSKILGVERQIPDFSRHLSAFCAKERGPILDKEGSPKNYRYRFIDPLMQSYVFTKGVRDKMLKPSQN